MGKGMLSCLLFSLVWASLGVAQSAPSPWTWEFVSSRVPKFEEKAKENKEWVVVEVLFRNHQVRELKLILAKEEFQAFTPNGKRIEIQGLLFRVQQFEGAKHMRYVGGMRRMETLSELEGGSPTWYFHSPGPVEVVVEGGRAYQQRLVLSRPKGKKPFRLKFNNVPELEIPLPK